MRFLLVRIFLSIALMTGFTAITQAGNIVDWSDYSLYTDYDKGDEELTLKFITYSDGNPKEDFELEMEIGDEDCGIELEYKSFQIKGECKLDIDKDDIRGLYDTSLVVTSLDSDETVYTDNTVKIEIDGYKEEFEWDKLKVDASYDEKKEKLELKIYLKDIKREPDYEYETEFKIDNKIFKKRLRYNKDDKELSISFSTPIDKDDIEDDYEIKFLFINRDLDDEKVGDEKIKFDVDIISEKDEFKWKKLKATALYDEERGRLKIELILGGIKTEPKENYKSLIEFEREDYNERFKYDKNKDALIAKYSIKIDEDDLGYYYDLDVIVEDKSKDEVFDDELDLKVEFLSEADDFNWDNLEVSASYNDNKEILYIELVLKGIKTKPVFIYTTELEFEDKEEFKKFTYDSDKNELRASIDIKIKEKNIEKEYELDIRIENDDQERVYKEDVDVKVLDYKDVVENEESSYDWENTSVIFDYSTTSQYLVLKVRLDNINDYPSLDYFTDITLSGINEEIGSKLRYDSQNKVLYGTYNLHIKENDIKDEYKMTMFINNEYKELQYLFTEEIDVIFDRDDSKKDEGKKYVSASTKKAVDNFTKKIYKRYETKTEAIEYFKVVIKSLDAYANQKTRYRSVIDDINYLLQEIIDNA